MTQKNFPFNPYNNMRSLDSLSSMDQQEYAQRKRKFCTLVSGSSIVMDAQPCARNENCSTVGCGLTILEFPENNVQRDIYRNIPDAEISDVNADGTDLSAMSHYAVATTDTAFKHMFSVSMGNDSSIVISFLNAFVPAFRGTPIVQVVDAPVAIPPIRRVGQKHTFMDLHVVSSTGIHYIIEMQSERHIMFDERALFYACATYALQAPERDLVNDGWAAKLTPVIALQVLGYDTNRVRGQKSGSVDGLVDRVREHPLPDDQFIKHFRMTDVSGQTLDYLQLIQLELPRAERRRKLFPPVAEFSIVDWWISILQHANEYSPNDVERLHHVEKIMPESIYKALKRLDLHHWNPRITAEYKEDLSRRDLYALSHSVELDERERTVLERVARNLIAENMSVEKLVKVTGLSTESINALL